MSTVLVVLLTAAAVVAVVLSKVVAAWSGAWWDVAWTAASFAAVAGMMLARGTAAPVDREPWGLWVAAATYWFAGQVMWDVYGVTGFPQSPNLADMGWWMFAVLVIVSLLRSRARSRSVRVVALAETLPVIGAAIALSLAELWHDASVSSLALAPKLSALVYPAVYVAAAVLMLQAMFVAGCAAARSHWRHGSWRSPTRTRRWSPTVPTGPACRRTRPAGELERCAGTQFDPEVVTAFLGTMHHAGMPLAHALVNS